MAFSTTGLLNVHVIIVFRHGKHLMYLVNEIICEDLIEITQIIVEILGVKLIHENKCAQYFHKYLCNFH